MLDFIQQQQQKKKRHLVLSMIQTVFRKWILSSKGLKVFLQSLTCEIVINLVPNIDLPVLSFVPTAPKLLESNLLWLLIKIMVCFYCGFDEILQFTCHYSLLAYCAICSLESL